ncbi:hypothetical protein [Cardinium endosymbiont of Culicoides punctatus]|uniref:hypothetical protein n=1 Tax=Cardinium endosymbiont of Culicoides punctatus TaxID=2304601 RepID=UPI001058778E|nr:hypothetical protein [Cardinium endosymbiont of Culicoides punctatus]TDG95419.1 hypothetical protein CCPUN_03950 [Cardinium endosymbiont of Culicoides punctatus]
MKTITIDIVNDNAFKLLKELESLKIIRLHKEKRKHKIREDKGDSREEVLANIKRGIKDVKLFKQGKLKTISEEDFIKGLCEL